MLDLQRAPQTVSVFHKLTTPEAILFRALTDSEQTGHTVIPTHFSAHIGFDSEMCDCAVKDLRVLLKRSSGPESPACRIELVLNPEIGQRKRDHQIRVTKGEITVIGQSEWGCAAGIYHIERLIRLNGIPALKRGIIPGKSILDPALVNSAFKAGGYNDFSWPEAWHDEYLARLARSGATGINLIFNLDNFVRSDIFPELNDPAADAKLAMLGRIVRRLKKHSLELYVTWYLRFYPSDHPLFKRLPEVRGSSFRQGGNANLLCTSSELTRSYFEEQFGRIHGTVPDLGGAILIVGCEGFLHCYTANAVSLEENSTCPHCNHADPEQTVAATLNRIAAVIHAKSPDAKTIIWTYNIQCWAKNHGTDFIHRLSPDCSLMVNFDTGDTIQVGDSCGRIFDYSITAVGPGADYRFQSEAAREAGIELLAKCENGSALEFSGIRYLPAVTRWTKKYQHIVKSGAAGALLNWDFIGYTGSLSADLGNWMAWDDGIRNLPERFAERLFGKTQVPMYRKVWKAFDQAIDHHPFSSFTVGFSKGPFYLGFAQPLIYNDNEVKDFPDEFNMAGKTMIVSQLSWCRPFGVKNCLSALKKEEKLWAAGVEILKAGQDPSEAGKFFLADAQIVLSMMRTAINMVEFYYVRDMLFSQPFSRQPVQQMLQLLYSIAVREKKNTSEGLAALEVDPDFTFSYIYHYGFTVETVKFKLQHLEKLLNHILPFQYYSFVFCCHQRQEWHEFSEQEIFVYENFDLYNRVTEIMHDKTYKSRKDIL